MWQNTFNAMSKPLKLYISTCPNDTYAFEALINRRIDMQGLEFDVSLMDIECLNSAVLEGDVDICKISFSLYPKIESKYCILNCGAALGTNNGQVFVRRQGEEEEPIRSIAIPGIHTTAYALLQRYFQPLNNVEIVPMLFSEIPDAITSKRVDAGVLIHEGRFRYRELGLSLIADLGELWFEDKHIPLPLGGIVAKRELGEDVRQRVEHVILNSLCYAVDNPNVPLPFIRHYAAECSDDVIAKHIELFVNTYTLDLGETGVQAIEELTRCKL